MAVLTIDLREIGTYGGGQPHWNPRPGGDADTARWRLRPVPGTELAAMR